MKGAQGEMVSREDGWDKGTSREAFRAGILGRYRMGVVGLPSF